MLGEQAECTFKPKINRNSDKAVKVIRGKESIAMMQNRYQVYIYLYISYIYLYSYISE